jgi:hypothetical protein
MEELWLKAEDIGDFIDLAGTLAEHTGARETSKGQKAARYTQAEMAQMGATPMSPSGLSGLGGPSPTAGRGWMLDGALAALQGQGLPVGSNPPGGGVSVPGAAAIEVYRDGDKIIPVVDGMKVGNVGDRIQMGVDPAFEPKPKETTGFWEWARKSLAKAGFD